MKPLNHFGSLSLSLSLSLISFLVMEFQLLKHDNELRLQIVFEALHTL
jgi:hypothetical protein